MIYSFIHCPRKENVMENSHISALHAKHDAIKDKIRVELSRPLPDTMRLAALKKQKLRLKEEMFHS